MEIPLYQLLCLSASMVQHFKPWKWLPRPASQKPWSAWATVNWKLEFKCGQPKATNHKISFIKNLDSWHGLYHPFVSILVMSGMVYYWVCHISLQSLEAPGIFFAFFMSLNTNQQHPETAGVLVPPHEHLTDTWLWKQVVQGWNSVCVASTCSTSDVPIPHIDETSGLLARN